MKRFNSTVLVLSSVWVTLSACQESQPGAHVDEKASSQTQANSDVSSDRASVTSDPSSDRATAESNNHPDTSIPTPTMADSNPESPADASVGSALDAGTETELPDTGPAGLAFGHPVYTPAEVDARSTPNPEYTRLAGSWAGEVVRAHTSYGAEISSVERDLLKDDSVFMKVQAVLWAADAEAFADAH